MPDYCCKYLKMYSAEDEPVCYDEVLREYYIKHLNKNRILCLDFCPWCGSKLPDRLREVYLDTLEADYGIETDMGEVQERNDIPEEFKTDEWWKKRKLPNNMNYFDKLTRTEILGILESLAPTNRHDKLLKKKKDSYELWEDISDWYDDKINLDKIHLVGKEAIGKFLYDEKELKEITEFFSKFKNFIEKIGFARTDKEYLSQPEWKELSEKAKNLLIYMLRNNVKHGLSYDLHTNWPQEEYLEKVDSGDDRLPTKVRPIKIGDN